MRVRCGECMKIQSRKIKSNRRYAETKMSLTFFFHDNIICTSLYCHVF